MADRTPQSFENHAKIVPAYHVVLMLVVVFYLVGSIWQIVSDPGLPATLDLLLLVAICVIVWFLRIWPLKVQDRLIRLEETLRMREVLPEELRTRIGELRRRHFIALRFAPDEELPGLVQRVLDGELTTGKEIKQAIRSWRADHFRV